MTPAAQVPARPRRLRRRVALAALASAATLGALLAAELAVRTAFPNWAPRSARMTTFWKYDARYGWVHVPNMTGRFASEGFDIEVRINSKGFRGREIPYARSGTSRRVLMLGDSHVWGFGVDEERSFVRLLANRVPDLEIVNLGVSGYSTDQELLLYQDEGYRYGADVVVLVVAHNDLRANTRTIESAVYGKPRFLLNGDELVLDNHPVPRPSWFKLRAFDLSARSYLLTRALRVLDQSRRNADVETGPAADSDDREARERVRNAPFPWTPAHRITARLILELHQSVSRLQPQAQLLVVLADLRNGRGPEAVDYLGRLAIPAVALDGAIDPMDPAWHLPDGLHWTEAGHARVAELLAGPLQPLLERGTGRPAGAGLAY
jgi:lysophospholipase L1-like esterase